MTRWPALVGAIVICGLAVATLVARAGENGVLRVAATALAKEPTYRTTFSIETKSAAAFGAQMSGVFDQRTKLGRFTMQYVFPGAKRISCTMVSGAQKIFIAIASKHRPQYGGKLWVESDIAGLVPVQGFGTKGFDPSSFAAIHDLKKTGTDTVRGVATTTYRGTLRLNKRALNIDNPAVTKAVPSTTRVDIWISGDGLIRRVRDAFVTRTGTLAFTTTTTFEYYDFGVPISVTAPPASQVAQGNAQNAIAACIS